MESDGTLSRAVAVALRRAFPGANGEGARLLGSGWNADAWRVPAAGGDLVVRVPRRAWARGEIERQTCLAPKLAAHGVPVPPGWRLLRDGSGEVLAGVYRYVEGSTAPARGHGRRRLVRPIARLLEQLHTFPVAEALACNAEPLDPWEGRWQPIIERHAESLPQETRVWVEQAGERLHDALRSAGTPVLVQGDLQPEHLLFSADADLVAVLDFSGPLVTDAAMDFGRLIQFWDQRFAMRVFESYSLRQDNAFMKRAVLYAALEPLRTITVEAEMGTSDWTAWARRKLASHAWNTRSLS